MTDTMTVNAENLPLSVDSDTLVKPAEYGSYEEDEVKDTTEEVKTPVAGESAPTMSARPWASILDKIPQYGNYGGPNYSAGVVGGDPQAIGAPEPIDELDAIFKEHDIAYSLAPELQTSADAKMINNILDLLATHTWVAANPKGAAFGTAAVLAFGAKMLLSELGIADISSATPVSNSPVRVRVGGRPVQSAHPTRTFVPRTPGILLDAWNTALAKAENPNHAIDLLKLKRDRRRVLERLLARAGIEPNPGPNPKAKRRSFDNALRQLRSAITTMHLTVDALARSASAHPQTSKAAEITLSELIAQMALTIEAAERHHAALIAILSTVQRGTLDAPLAAMAHTHSSGALATIKQLRSWIKDLTTEGIEPNPGPVPISDIKAAVVAMLDEASKILDSPVYLDDSVSAQRAAQAQLWQSVLAISAGNVSQFMDTSSSVAISQFREWAYSSASGTTVRSVTDYTYAVRVGVITESLRRAVMINPQIASFIKGATRGEEGQALTSFLAAVRTVSPQFDGQLVAQWFQTFLSRLTLDQPAVTVKYGTAARMLYVAASLMQASAFMDAAAMTDEAFGAYALDVGGTSLSPDICTTPALSAADTTDDNYMLFPFTPGMTATVSTAVYGYAVSMKVFMSESAGQTGGIPAGAALDPWRRGNWGDNNVAIVPVLSSYAYTDPAFLSALTLAYIQWPYVQVRRLVNIVDNLAAGWKSAGSFVDFDLIPNTFNTILPGPAPNGSSALYVLYVVCDQPTKVDDVTTSSPLTLGIPGTTVALTVNGAAGTQASIATALWTFFNSGAYYRSAANTLWRYTMTYFASKACLEDFNMLMAGIVPACGKPTFTTYNGVSQQYQGGYVYYGPTTTAPANNMTEISSLALLQVAKQGRTTPLGIRVYTGYGISALPVNLPPNFTIGSVNVFLDMALLNGWVVIDPRERIPDTTIHQLSACKVSMLQHLCGSTLAHVVDALAEHTGYSFDLWSALESDMGGPMARLIRRGLFASPITAFCGIKPLTADDGVQWPNYLSQYNNSLTVDRYLPVARNPHWLTFEHVRPKTIMSSLPKVDDDTLQVRAGSPGGYAVRFAKMAGKDNLWASDAESTLRLLTTYNYGSQNTVTDWYLSDYSGSKLNQITASARMKGISRAVAALTLMPMQYVTNGYSKTYLYSLPPTVTPVLNQLDTPMRLVCWSSLGLIPFCGSSNWLPDYGYASVPQYNTGVPTGLFTSSPWAWSPSKSLEAVGLPDDSEAMFAAGGGDSGSTLFPASTGAEGESGGK